MSEAIMQKDEELPAPYELVTGGGFRDATEAQSTKRANTQLLGNHEEADTRLVFYLCEAVNNSYERVLVVYKDTSTETMFLLVHFIPSNAVEVWIRSGTARKMQCYLTTHTVSASLTQHHMESNQLPRTHDIFL